MFLRYVFTKHVFPRVLALKLRNFGIGAQKEIIQTLKKNEHNYKSIDFRNTKIDEDFLLEISRELSFNENAGNIIWPEINKRGLNEEIEKKIYSKLWKNNVNFERFPNYLIHCLLSMHVYNVDKNNSGKPVEFNDSCFIKYNRGLKNWQLCEILQSVENSYFGAIYLNEKYKQCVLAHRTSDSKLKQMLNNFNEKFKTDKSELQKYIELATKSAKNISREYNFSITGHSAGGRIAQLCLAIFYLNDLRNARAITFNNPGSSNLIQSQMGPYNSIDMSCLDIITFLPEANHFNVADTHIGIIYGFKKELLSKVKKNNSFNLKRNTINMANILAELETDFDIDKLKPIKEINHYIPSNFKLICCWPTVDNLNTKDTSSILRITEAFDAGFQQMFQKIFSWLFKYSWNRFYVQQAVRKFYMDYEKNIGNEYKKILKLNSIDNVDKCLYQLNQINDLDYLENDALKFQLEKLKNIYTIETKLNEDKKIVALDKQYPVEKIKEIMIRLLDVEPDLKTKLDSPLTKSKLHSPRIPASYLPNDICPNFVGRKNILNQIRENFSGKNKQIVILNSISGGGKSCIANEYGKEWRKMHDCIVLWIDSTSKNLDKKFSNISESFGIFTDKNRSVERLIQIVHDKVQNLNQNFLFIFDNCEDLGKIETYLNNLPKNAFALVTTRNNKIQESLKKTSLIISLEPFNEDEAKQFEQKILDLTETNLTTVLELIFKFHKNKMIIPFDLNFITRTIKIEIESNSFENFIESNKADDYRTFGEKINRGVLFELLESIDKDAVQILFYSSFLDPFLIPIKIYTKFFKLEMNKKTQDILTDNSLISEVQNEYGKCFIIHSLTQEKISQYLKREENKQLEITIENKLCEVLSDFDHIVKEISKKEIRTNNYHNNFERIINKVLESKIVNKEQKVSFILNYARFNEGLDNYEKAQEYFEKSLEYFEKEDYESIANVWNNIGSVYRSQEKYDLALDKHEESLKRFRSIHKADEHSSIAETLNKIGSVYLSQGKYDLAMKRFRESLEILRKIHGTDKSLSIGQTHNNIGLTYYNQGKNFLALEYYEKSLHIYKNVYESEKNSSSAITYNNIGLVYYTQGKYDLALKSYEKAYEIYRKIYGTDEHSLIITTLNNIGSVYLNQKKFNFAIEKYEQSIETSKNLYKTDENSLSAETYCKIGTAYSMQEKPDLAFEFYQKSLDIYTKINDAGNNYNVAQILNKIGFDYFSQNKYSLAIEYYKKSLEILLKIYAIEENSLITITLNNIATVYYTNKEYELAIDYYEKSLEIYRKIDDTSSIETTLNNIQLVKYKINENYKNKNYKDRMIFFASNFLKKLQKYKRK